MPPGSAAQSAPLPENVIISNCNNVTTTTSTVNYIGGDDDDIYSADSHQHTHAKSKSYSFSVPMTTDWAAIAQTMASVARAHARAAEASDANTHHESPNAKRSAESKTSEEKAAANDDADADAAQAQEAVTAAVNAVNTALANLPLDIHNMVNNITSSLSNITAANSGSGGSTIVHDFKGDTYVNGRLISSGGGGSKNARGKTIISGVGNKNIYIDNTYVGGTRAHKKAVHESPPPPQYSTTVTMTSPRIISQGNHGRRSAAERTRSSWISRVGRWSRKLLGLGRGRSHPRTQKH